MERDLIILAVIGGAIGALAGMFIWHHKTHKRKFQIWVPLALILHIVVCTFATYQNNHLLVTSYECDIEDTNLNLRIVQISDLHNATIYWDSDAITNKVKKQNPDIIVITGDLVDSRFKDNSPAINTAKSLSRIADTYYVTGNHELRFEAEEQAKFLEELQSSGIHVLTDEWVKLEDNSGTEFALIGIDDTSLGKDSTYELISSIPEELPRILLAHEPQYVNGYSEVGVDLMLSGHYHGGQFIIAGKGVVTPEFEFFPDYTYGERKVGITTLITSRGIGNSIIPWRINNFPEIVVVDIK